MSKISGNIVEYNGKTIEIDGMILLEKGKDYDSIMCDLGMMISEQLGKDYDVICLFSNSDEKCPKSLKLPETIEKLIEKVCCLQSSEIFFDGNLFSLGSGITTNSMPLVGRSFEWAQSSTGTSSTFTFATEQGLEGLPSDYQDASTIVRVLKNDNGKSRVVRVCKESSGSVSIDYKDYPVCVDVEKRIIYKGEDISLRSSIILGGPGNNEGCPTWEIADHTTSGLQKKFSINEVFSSMLSKLSDMMSYVNSLKNYKIGSNKFITKTGIKGAIGGLIAQVEENCKKIMSLNDIDISGCSNCDQSNRGSIQDLADCFKSYRESVEGQLEMQRSINSTLQLQLNNLENTAVNTSFGDNQTGQNVVLTGSCSNGSCPLNNTGLPNGTPIIINGGPTIGGCSGGSCPLNNGGGRP